MVPSKKFRLIMAFLLPSCFFPISIVSRLNISRPLALTDDTGRSSLFAWLAASLASSRLSSFLVQANFGRQEKRLRSFVPTANRRFPFLPLPFYGPREEKRDRKRDRERGWKSSKGREKTSRWRVREIRTLKVSFPSFFSSWNAVRSLSTDFFERNEL